MSSFFRFKKENTSVIAFLSAGVEALKRKQFIHSINIGQFIKNTDVDPN